MDKLVPTWKMFAPTSLGTAATWEVPQPRKIEITIGAESLCFIAMWFFIGLVAAYDTYLTVKFQDLMIYLELNPLGQWIMQMEDGKIAVFLGCKFAGTVIVLGVLPLLYLYRQALGMFIAGVLTSVQFGLMLFLLFG